MYYYKPRVLTHCAIETSTQAEDSNVKYNNATITLIKNFELGEHTLNESLSISIEDTQSFIEVISFLITVNKR